MLGFFVSFACVGVNAPDSSGDSDTSGGVETDTSDSPPTDGDGDGILPPADCDDTNASVHPGAAEVCGNGLDDNCDNTAGACSWAGAHDVNALVPTIFGRRTNGLAGDSIAAGDFDGDGVLELVIAAPEASEGQPRSGAVYVLSTPITESISVADATSTLGGDREVGSTGRMLAVADTDGDGRSELYVSAAQLPNTTPRDEGRVFILRGVPSGRTTLDDQVPHWSGEHPHDGAGGDLTVANDLSGDGLQDLVVVSPGDPDARTAPAIYVVGGTGGELSNAPIRIYGEPDTAFRGASVVDLDADGLEDLVTTFRSTQDTQAAWSFLSPIGATSTGDDRDGTLTVVSGQYQGDPKVLDVLGDATGDGSSDLALSIFEQPGGTLGRRQGAVWILPASAFLGDGTLSAAAATIRGADDHCVGASMAHEDVNGDAIVDLAVGDWCANNQDGDAMIFEGPLSGNLAREDAAATFVGSNQMGLGSSLAFVDVTGDHVDDLLISARNQDGDEVAAGAVFVFGATP